MPPMAMEFWKKLNANEKMVMYGGGIVVVAFLLGLAGGGLGSYAGSDILGVIVVGVIYWLKYSPNKITWPAPVQTIVLVITGIAAIFGLLGGVYALSYIASLWGLATIVNAVGVVMMAWFAYKEYQAMPKPAAPAPPTTPPAA